MPRVKRSTKRTDRRKRVLKLAKLPPGAHNEEQNNAVQRCRHNTNCDPALKWNKCETFRAVVPCVMCTNPVLNGGRVGDCTVG